MRTHKQIITEAGGPTAFAGKIDASAGAAKQWSRLNRIPGRYWAAIQQKRLASLTELALAASPAKPLSTLVGE